MDKEKQLSEKLQNSQATRKAETTVSKAEDLALKTAAQYLGEELLPYLNVKGKAKRVFPTEVIYLELKQMYQDFNYEMEDGRLAHLEFQTTYLREDDLRRFREYEAVTSRTYKKEVVTYVLFSGKIKNPTEYYKTGINKFNFVPVTMQNDNADDWMTKTEAILRSGRLPDAKELLPLILMPLMSGASSIKERISYAFKVLRDVEKRSGKTEKLEKMQAILYAFAGKFLKTKELDQVKEEIKMTVLGEMLREDGIKEGIKKGERKGERKGVKALVITCKEIGLDYDTTIEKVMLRFDYGLDEAEEAVKSFWDQPAF